MRYLDLFAGIGGFHSGFDRVGWDFAGFCEWNATAVKSYKAIHDTEGAIEWHDITTVPNDDFRNLRGDIDLIAGGFPCQAFSTNGKQLGFADIRGTLFFEATRAAEQIKPRFLLLENVRNIISHDEGRTFATMLTTLHGMGYAHIEWGVFNSKYWGVPQNRERVYILAELRESPTEPYILPLLQRQATNGIKREVAEIIDRETFDDHILDLAKFDGFIERQGDLLKIREATKQGFAYAEDGDCINFSNPKSKTRRGRVGRKVAQTLLTGVEQAVFIDGHLKMLSPLETWRLQDFTDEQFHRARAVGISDTQLYKQAGNSVTVKVVEVIARQIQARLDAERGA